VYRLPEGGKVSSGHTMALGSIHHLKEMSNINISSGEEAGVPRAEKITTLMC